MSVLFHDTFFDHVLEIFWSEKCAVLLNCLRIPRSEIIGFEGVLGALKVISLSVHFCNVKIR